MTSVKLGWNLNGEIHQSKMYSSSVLGCLCNFFLISFKHA